ncbi:MULTISPECIES: fimbrial protein [unclassified Serratia (in: enterobacteria)]|uniref:fimbrial protein n=1 Tax=unclassified Serratia (in: enterobacteria) TaxID=2647522 RepID=UPI000DA2EAD8|nr:MULTISPECIES: fimbrial protein [unclassified Serratia (in: enterobacteria)]MCA4823893.1 type 1 fimbrial protein [Serratia rubidaea]QPT11985.1 type 1 fimbrial protein [Serratia rubidaea]CAE1147683.1 PAP fimbrial minor pilin protein [Serratia sp. Tan611]SQJ16045.1 PAP fimbrial minor pilin protein precursor [Serratia rubidaea]
MRWLKPWITVVLLLLLGMLAMGPVAFAGLSGRGTVHMGGAIIDSACAIAAGERDQTVDMGTVPVSQIVSQGQGSAIPFSVRLVNCSLERYTSRLPDWQYFQITFDGPTEGNGFGLQGEARGLAIQISDEQGNVAAPGVAMPKSDIHSGNMQLNYFIRLIGDKKTLRTGDYFSTIRFKLDYY